MDVLHAKEHFLDALERYGRVYEALRQRTEACDADHHWSRQDLAGVGLFDAYEAFVALRRTHSPDASTWFATEIEHLETSLRALEAKLVEE